MYIVSAHRVSNGGLHLKFKTQPFISSSLLATTGGDGLPIINHKNIVLAIREIITREKCIVLIDGV